MQEVFTDSQFDRDLFTISLFGSQNYEGMTEDYCREIIKHDNDLTFDVFFDKDQEKKLFFDDFAGINGNNEIYIVAPNGSLQIFDGYTGEELKIWFEEMYNLYY